MNYLILTPDGVGSTILQRLVTMALYLEKVPVMNTHELTNGLILKNGVAIKNFQNCLTKFRSFAKNYNWIDQSKTTYDFWNKTHIC